MAPLHQERAVVPVADAELKDTIHHSSRVFELVILPHVTCDIVLHAGAEACSGSFRTLDAPGDLVGFDGEDAKVFSCYVQTRHRPSLKATSGIATDQNIRDFFPRLVDLRPGSVVVGILVAGVFGREKVADEEPKAHIEIDPSSGLRLWQAESGKVSIVDLGGDVFLDMEGVGASKESYQTVWIGPRRNRDKGRGQKRPRTLCLSGSEVIKDLLHLAHGFRLPQTERQRPEAVNGMFFDVRRVEPLTITGHAYIV